MRNGPVSSDTGPFRKNSAFPTAEGGRAKGNFVCSTVQPGSRPSDVQGSGRDAPHGFPVFLIDFYLEVAQYVHVVDEGFVWRVVRIEIAVHVAV